MSDLVHHFDDLPVVIQTVLIILILGSIALLFKNPNP